MIDTLEKLYKTVDAHRMAILAEAVREYDRSNGEEDVWGTYWISAEEQVDFNIYRPDESKVIHVYAYALKRAEGYPDFVKCVNTEIDCWVADIKIEEN